MLSSSLQALREAERLDQVVELLLLDRFQLLLVDAARGVLEGDGTHDLLEADVFRSFFASLLRNVVVQACKHN